MASVDIQMVERGGVWSMRETMDQRIARVEDEDAHERKQFRRSACVDGVAVFVQCLGLAGLTFFALAMGDAVMTYAATTGISRALAAWAGRIHTRGPDTLAP